MADIFMSHSVKDDELAAAIGERIRRERPTWSLFYDKDHIRAGQRWQERLREELQSCRVVLAVLSHNWLSSPWCFAEAVTATFRGKDVVGIETEDLTADDLARMPPILHERQRVRLRDGDDRPWQEILDALDRSGLDPDDWFPIPPNVGPYPGLVAFDERDAGVFFGRKQEITEYLGILDTLRGPDRSQLLVISGASGSGKSSLLRAGLIPRLRRKPEWVVISAFEVAREPVRNMLDRLDEALARVGGPAQELESPKPVNDERDLESALDERFRRLEQSSGAWVLLPLDQAEVLVTGDQQAHDSARLLEALGQVLGRRTRRLVIAATIRTEFVSRLEAAFARSSVRLRQAPLSTIGSLAEIIEKPAERFGLELEPGLSERIVEDVRTADALPLLAYTLKSLYEEGGADRRLTLDEYRGLGGAQGAIAAKLEWAMTDPEPTADEARALRRAFTRHLIRVDELAVEGERLLRRVVSRASLSSSADRVIGRLVDAGLLVTRDRTIELAHERLIADWPTLPLITWLTQDATDRRLIDQLRQRVDDDTLPAGLLAQAEELLHRDSELAGEEPALATLVERSQNHRRSRERRRRMLLAGASLAALVFAASAWFAWTQRNEAITARNVAQTRLEAVQISLQAILSAYISYLDRVGFPADPVSIRIVDGENLNAWYDGKSMSMFIHSRLAGDVDAPRREYTHHVLYKGQLDTAANAPMRQIESALADYFPCSFSNRALFGEIVAAVMKLPRPYLRNLSNERKFDETPETDGEEHDRGEIWAGAFWEVRSLLGRELADRVLARTWRGMTWGTGERDTSSKFVGALLSSTREMASDAELAKVTAALRKRGFPRPG